MKFKIGDFVEVIEILPEWDIYKDKNTILNRRCKIVSYTDCGLYEVNVGLEDAILLKECRLIPFKSEKQLLFNFMY